MWNKFHQNVHKMYGTCEIIVSTDSFENESIDLSRYSHLILYTIPWLSILYDHDLPGQLI